MEDQKSETDYLSLLVSVQYAPEKKIWPKQIFSDSVEMEFSGIKVKVPVGYDEQLKIYFGNYMEFPPVEKRGTWHSAKFLPDIDYKSYYLQEYGVDHSSVCGVKYCMHAGGEIDGQMLTNTKEAYEYWLSKGQLIFEFDVCETDDHKYVTTHDFNYEAFVKMGINTIPTNCTRDWFLNQCIYDGRYHALSLETLIEDLTKGVIKGLMIDPKDFTFDGTERLLAYLADLCEQKELKQTTKLTVELYNSDMIKAAKPYADRFTLQYCVDDDIQQGNSAETRALCNDDLISYLKSTGIKAVSYPWKQAVENLSLLKQLKQAGFIIYSRTRNDLFKDLLTKCGIDYNIVDHFVAPDQLDPLQSYKSQYYAKYQPEIDKVYRKKVLTVGVYDMLHIGHVNLFRRAQRLGDSLTVAVQSSEVVLKYKPTAKLVYSTEERMYMVKSIRFVDDVITYEAVDDIVKTADFDIFVTGPDQCHEGFQRAIQWCKDNGKEAIVLPRTEGISSSWLKEQIKSM